MGIFKRFFIFDYNERLKIFSFLLWDTSYTEVTFFRYHNVDFLVPKDKKWWHLPICGVEIWL